MVESTSPADARGPAIRPARRRTWAWDVVFLAGLVVAIGYAYAPSLDHAHRADQWYYFLDTLDCGGFGDTIRSTYSHNRTATTKHGGDQALFRPVLFAVLAAERSWFGYESRGWQAVGILLHVVVVILFHLLARMLVRDGSEPAPGNRLSRVDQTIRQLAPYALTAFFALNFAILEQVIWSHVNSYMLFLSLVLAAILLLFRTPAGNGNRATLLVAWTMLLFAAFTYETGQVIAVLAAGYVLLGRKSTRPALAALAFCCIPVLYQTANRIDLAVHYSPRMDHDPSLRIPILSNPVRTWTNFGHYARYVGLQPFEDGTDKIRPGARIQIGEPDYITDPPEATTLVLWGVVAAVFVLGTVSIALRSLRDGVRCERLLRLGVFGGILAVHAAVIVLGRLNLRGHAVLADNSYYTYPALCLLLLIVCVGLSEAAGRMRAWMSLPVVGGLLIVLASRTALHHVHAVRDANEQMREWSRHEVEQVRDMLAWISEHRNEPDFSLAFDTQPSEEIEKVHGIAKLWLISRKWTNSRRAKYVVLAHKGKPRLVMLAEYDRLLRRKALRPFVELVEAASSYNLFRHGDRYYATLHWDGSYDPRRQAYHYLVEGSSPEKVRGRYAKMIQKQASDVARGLFVPPTEGLVLEGYRGYNVVHFRSHYYAVRQGDGPFDLVSYRRGERRDAFDAPDLATVQQLIDARMNARAAAESLVPRLIESNQRGYNIVLQHGRYYGIRQDDGAFDLARYRRGEYCDAVDAADVAAVMRSINAITTTAGRERTR